MAGRSYNMSQLLCRGAITNITQAKLGTFSQPPGHPTPLAPSSIETPLAGVVSQLFVPYTTSVFLF